MSEHGHAEGDEPTGPVVRDKRRIDPVTGQVREGVGSPTPSVASTAALAKPQAQQLDDELSALEKRAQRAHR